MRLRIRRRSDEAAQRDLDRAERDLSTVRDQWPAVRDAAGTMNRHLHENNFAHRIRVAMGVEAK
jgi:hypothetical protein